MNLRLRDRPHDTKAFKTGTDEHEYHALMCSLLDEHDYVSTPNYSGVCRWCHRVSQADVKRLGLDGPTHAGSKADLKLLAWKKAKMESEVHTRPEIGPAYKVSSHSTGCSASA